MSNDPRRFSEEEVSKILRLATAHPETGSASDGMTLDELVRVAAEAGIDPGKIRSAVERLDEEPRHQPIPWLLGTRPYTEVVAMVSGEPTDENWDEVVAELRSAFRGPTGEATRLGKSSEWYGGSELTATQVSLTPANGRTRVKLRLTAWAVPLFAYGLVGFLGGAIVFAKLSVLIKLDPRLFAPATFLVAGLLLFGALLLTRLALGSWYKKKLGQMQEALRRVGAVLERPTVPVAESSTVAEPTEIALRLGNSEP